MKMMTTDFHTMVSEMADIPRKQAKTINLGLFYGMGKGKLMSQLGVDSRNSNVNFLAAYNERVPFVKQLMNDTMNKAGKKGYLVYVMRVGVVGLTCGNLRMNGVRKHCPWTKLNENMANI